MATLRIDDLILPSFPPFMKDARKLISDIENFPTRKDVILLFSYPKSWNHWLNEIVPRLLRNTLGSDHMHTDQMVEYAEDLESIKFMPSPRVMTSHLPPQNLPKDHIAKDGKIIHIIRNPKDVALSTFHHYNQDPHVTEIHGVSKDLSAFLDSFLKGVCMRVGCSRKRVGRSSEEKPRELPCYVLRGPETGIVGDWKSSFTAADNEKFDLVFKEKMKDSKLKILFS